MALQKYLLWLLPIFSLFTWLYVIATDFSGITYDTKNWTITITYSWESITIADKNVWATTASYWKDADADSYGLYYQWWWMTWYKYFLTPTEAILNWFEKIVICIYQV